MHNIIQPKKIYIVAEGKDGDITFAEAHNACVSITSGVYCAENTEFRCNLYNVNKLESNEKIYGFEPDELLELIHEQEKVNG